MYVEVWIDGEISYELGGKGIEEWLEDNLYSWTGKTIWFI